MIQQALEAKSYESLGEINGFSPPTNSIRRHLRLRGAKAFYSEFVKRLFC